MTKTTTKKNTKKNVAILQDGATDELVSVLLAASMKKIEINSIMILNADCLAGPTYQATKSLLKLVGHDYPVHISGERVWNAFPWEYRPYAMMVNLLPMTTDYGKHPLPPMPRTTKKFSDVLIEAEKAGKTPLTVLCLSPMSDLAEAIHVLGDEISSYIDEIIWMGGAYTPAAYKKKYGTAFPGNIDTGIAPGANPNAEWNAYSDYKALDTVLKSGLAIKMFPLNVTNQVLLDPDILTKYFIPKAKNKPLIDLAAQMYAMVAFQGGYSFWDTITTAYLGKPDLFKFTTQKISVNTSLNPATQGTISLDKKGYPVQIPQALSRAKIHDFYGYLTKQLATF